MELGDWRSQVGEGGGVRRLEVTGGGRGGVRLEVTGGGRGWS